MGLPHKLKNMNLFIDGGSWLGIVTEVTPPKMARKMEGYRAGGMDAEVDIDMGGEKMEGEFTFGGLTTDIISTFGSAVHDAAQFRFAGAYVSNDDGSTVPVEIVMRGRIAEFDEGSAKVGDDTEHKYKMSVSYYKRIENGRVIIEKDDPNFIFKVKGVDRLAAQRAAIGL